MKNYTSLGVMKASEVVPTFTEEKVTEETFEKEKQQGTLYKGFEIPKNAKMLKFRYYSPDGTLIEQNNVPIVYDGTGIKSVQTYYLLTNEKSGITLQSDDWNEEVQTVTAEKRFLWTYIKTTYTNNVYTCTDPCISSVFGEQGERGAVYLGHYADNQTAYSKNTPAIFTGDYYLNLTDSYLYVYNKEENVWAKISDFSDYRYNQSMNDIFESLEDSTQVENFMKIKVAWIQRLSASMARLEQLYSNTIKLVQGTDLNGNTTGGAIQSENFVSGSTGWKIDYNGNAEFNNATVRGQIEATSGSFKGTVTATSGTLQNITATNLTVKKGTFDNVSVNGFYTSNFTPFQPIAMINIGYNNNVIQLTNSKNVKSVVRSEEGVYTVYLEKSVALKNHTYNSNKYIDVFVVSNAADSFQNGFVNPIHCTPNWLRNYVDGRLAEDADGKTLVTYVILYFADNNSDSLQDPVSSQCFIFGTESD